MATTPDVLVDRYEVGRLLGAGGMAEVYEGHDRLLARRVAIKVLLPQYARDPAFLARFKREAQAAASLTHSNIVGVYDTGVQAGTNFIVMEYVEGRTLRDVIKSEGPLLPVRAAEIGGDVCSALAAAHARGIIHRDIKPANIMITPDGGVKVMDFGIARAVTSEAITQTAAVVGTAQYISPEQAQATGVDARTDLYSLGVCLYEMLAGRVPFTGNTPVAIAYQHVRDDPPPLRQFNPDVPADLESVTMKAMAKNPDNRYQTAVELRQDLERVRRGQSVLATPLLADRPTVAIGRTATPYEQGTSVLSGPMTQTGYEGRAARHEGGRGRRTFGWILVFIAVVLLAAAAAYAIVNQLQTTPEEPAAVSIPNVVGQKADEARARLEAAGFKVTEQGKESEEAQGTVLETNPKGGEQAPAGSTVALVVSAGPSVVEVPKFTGLTLAEARSEADKVGLEIRRDNSVPSENVPEGHIIAQNPNPGLQIAKGSTVRVTISTGPRPTTTTTPPTTSLPPPDSTVPPDSTSP
jgi:serine/threonine-protein kinase